MAPYTPLRSVKYLMNTPKSTPHSGHTNKMKPALAAKQRVVSQLILTISSRKPTAWRVMSLFPRKRRGGVAKKRKSETTKAGSEDVGNTYGIDHLKIGETKHDSDKSK